MREKERVFFFKIEQNESTYKNNQHKHIYKQKTNFKSCLICYYIKINLEKKIKERKCKMIIIIVLMDEWINFRKFQ